MLPGYICQRRINRHVLISAPGIDPAYYTLNICSAYLHMQVALRGYWPVPYKGWGQDVLNKVGEDLNSVVC